MTIKRRKKYEGKLDRRLMMAAVMSDRFLAILRPAYREELIEGDMMRRVLSWCFDFYDQYNRAPKSEIEAIYGDEVENQTIDPDLAEDVGDFLAGLSEEYEQEESLNVEYLAEKAIDKLKVSAYKQLARDIELKADDGAVDELERTMVDFKLPQTVQADVIDVFDADLFEDALEYQPKPLLHLPGPLSETIQDQFTEDSFVSFLGREKIGKTWTLMELGFRASRLGKRVLFVQAGDLSRRQQILRFHARLCGRSHKERYCGDVLIPALDCEYNQSGQCSKEQRAGFGSIILEWNDDGTPAQFKDFSAAMKQGYAPCRACEGTKDFKGASWFESRHITPMTAEVADRARRRFYRQCGEDAMLMMFGANYTINVKTIEAQLALLEAEQGWVPQMIIIDYADIMAPETFRKDFRHQENERWASLRRLSQERCCCVVTATQADAAAYTAKTLSMKNFSEDKRKLAHVTATFGLNQSPFEKRMGRMRWNEIVVREDDYDTTKCVTVLQSLKTARPLIASYR
jgi:hypothetical protein